MQFRSGVDRLAIWPIRSQTDLLYLEGQWYIRYAVSCGPITTGSCPTPKIHLEQRLRDLIQEAETWDMAPKLASLWRTSTYDPEENSDLSSDTRSGRHRFPFEEKFKILGCTMNRQGKAHEGIEERMQSAKKNFVDDVKIYRSKDVPWRVESRRMVEHALSVFCFGSEKLVLDPENSRQDQRMGNNGDDSSITLQKGKR